MLGVCCCGRWKSGRTSSANSPAAFATIGIGVGGTRGGRVVGATDLRIGIRLRGFKRSRGVAARSVVGGAGGEGGSDRGTAATGARSGYRPGRQEHPQSHGTGSGEVGGKGAVQEDHPGRSGGGSDAGGYFFASA